MKTYKVTIDQNFKETVKTVQAESREKALESFKGSVVVKCIVVGVKPIAPKPEIIDSDVWEDCTAQQRLLDHMEGADHVEGVGVCYSHLNLKKVETFTDVFDKPYVKPARLDKYLQALKYE